MPCGGNVTKILKNLSNRTTSVVYCPKHQNRYRTRNMISTGPKQYTFKFAQNNATYPYDFNNFYFCAMTGM